MKCQPGAVQLMKKYLFRSLHLRVVVKRIHNIVLRVLMKQLVMRVKWTDIKRSTSCILTYIWADVLCFRIYSYIYNIVELAKALCLKHLICA